MKIKWIYLGAFVGVAFLLTAYIFMWPPVCFERRDQHPTNQCINNLRILNDAIHQWAVEHGKHDGAPVSMSDLTPYIHNYNGEVITLSCFRGGTYAVTVVGAPPTCSLGGKISSTTKVRVDAFHYEYFGPAHFLP